MSWSWYSCLSDAFKKRAGRYIINRYLGSFLEDGSLLLDQLSVDAGDISLQNVSLNIKTINSTAEDAELPVEIVDGYIRGLSVSIPWKTLLTDHCTFNIDGMTLTVQTVQRKPKNRQETSSIFYSMYESFSSIHVAEECVDVLGHDKTKEENIIKDESILDDRLSSVGGVELLADAIDSIITRIKVKFTNTTIRLEYVPSVEPRGLALELKLDTVTYGEIEQSNQILDRTVKRIFFEGVSLYTDEFVFDTEEAVTEAKHAVEPPLQLASFSGRQELIVRFTNETNQLGLPRGIEDVEVNCGGIVAFHVFPHQIHTVLEILNSINNVSNDDDDVLVHKKQGVAAPATHHNVEALLQKSILMQYPSKPNNLLGNWTSSSISDSSEFMPVPKDKSTKSIDNDNIGEGNEKNSVFPRITVKMASFVAALIEKDYGISKLGGESDKKCGLDKMRDAAVRFFEYSAPPPRLFEASKMRLEKLHQRVKEACRDNKSSSAHFQIIGAPLKITIESNVVHDCSSKLAITVGDMSIREVLHNETIQILEFVETNKTPDFRLIYRSSISDKRDRITFTLNPVKFNFDPGLIDRTYLLCHFAELDPTCLKTVVKSKKNRIHDNTSNGRIVVDVKFSCPSFSFQVFIPKIDLRPPNDIPDFVSHFWSRRVHPESILFDFKDLNCTVMINGNDDDNDRLLIQLLSNYAQVSYLRHEKEIISHNLIEIRKSADNNNRTDIGYRYASSISIKINLDESRRLHWKYGSPLESGIEEYYVDGVGNRSNSIHDGFVKQINDALCFSQTCNNVCVDLKFDEISLILPSKHVYELVYNRLGNDLFLWYPDIYRIKQFLYGVDIPDPLKDDNNEGFSSGFCNRIHENIEEEDHETPSTSSSGFPRSNKTLEIHVDTSVVLNINKGQILISEDYDETMMVYVDTMTLKTAVGLERRPEITIFNLSVQDGVIKFGKQSSSSKTEHFADYSSSNLRTVFRKTDFAMRAWHDVLPSSPALLELSSKILFNPESNLKSIHLSFAFVEASVCLSVKDVEEQLNLKMMMRWIADFFTVVEYPVVGYVPPVILTEMEFDIRRSSLDLFISDAYRLTMSLGRVHILCNFLDSCLDMSIGLRMEDVGLFLACDFDRTLEDHSVTESVCFCDLDYLDLNVFLKDNLEVASEGSSSKPMLDLSCNCNLIRLRTCSDTISILRQIITDFISSDDGQPSLSDDNDDGNDDSINDNVSVIDRSSDDVTPDLADAMKESLNCASEPSGKRRSPKKSCKPGAQVFFFPDESKFPSDLGMSQSFYADPNAMTASDIRRDLGYDDDRDIVHDDDDNIDTIYDDNDDDDEFCILDNEIGTGIIPRSGEASVRCLLDGFDPIIVMDNHFAIPERSIDYLKTPKNFPDFQTAFTLKRMSILWKIYGGNDFSTSKEMKTDTKGQLQKMGMSVYVNPNLKETTTAAPKKSGKKDHPQDFVDSLKTKGGPGRNEEQMIEVYVHKLQLKHEIFPDDSPESSRQVVIIPDFEIRDRLAVSDINKLLYQYSSRLRPQRSNANMLTYKCVNLRQGTMIESNVIVSLQPFRINIDQDTLFFIVDFCCALFPDENHSAFPEKSKQAQVIKFNKSFDKVEIQNEGQVEDEGQVVDQPQQQQQKQQHHHHYQHNQQQKQPFIRSFTFSHDVPIRIDYLGKYVDLTHGALRGLLVGLAQLNCSELTLKRVSYRHGILGLDKLLSALISNWLDDVRKNQVPALLGGVGPMYSFLQLIQGIKDLIMLPLEQYKKDGRFIRGLQKGANSFTASTAMSFLDITNKMLGMIKFAAEVAFDIMSPEGAIVHGKLPHPNRGLLLRRSRPPTDVREGVFNAFALVREGLDETARTLMDAAANNDRRGISGAVGGVLKQMPSTMMRPVIVAASATSNVLEGVKNQVAPEVRKEEEDKWRTSV